MKGSSPKGGSNIYDYSFKILLAGDSGVGKSSLLLSFISNFVQDLSPTIGISSSFIFFECPFFSLSQDFHFKVSVL